MNRLDDIDFKTLSFKFLWYNADNKLIGVFGYSFVTDKPWGTSLSESLMFIAKAGLLPGSKKNNYEKILTGTLFTKRENEVLFHLVQGKTAREISILLNISTRTVEHHIENMKAKSDSKSKSELIEKAINFFNN
jgi:DNA-binding CsgD family transcriptional regulator